MICSEEVSSVDDVLNSILGGETINFEYEISPTLPPTNSFFKGKEASIYLSIPGIEHDMPITIQAMTSDYPPKFITNSTNGDLFIKYRPVGINSVSTKVTFKLCDVSSRYLNSWIYLVFYIRDNLTIKPFILQEVIIRAKRWIPKSRREIEAISPVGSQVRDDLPKIRSRLPSFEFIP